MRRPAFSLVEVLVTIAIVAVLVHIAIPSVVAAREAARMRQCQENLRQLGLACLEYESAHGHFPSGGWNWYWVGNPNRGLGENQPGGWFYNVLDFLEQQDLRAAGLNLDGLQRAIAIRDRCETPLQLANCPSRREARPYPQLTEGTSPSTNTVPDVPPRWAGRTDYAINSGDRADPDLRHGPKSLESVDKGQFKWLFCRTGGATADGFGKCRNGNDADG